VVSFTLVNANSQADILTLSDGAIINLNAYTNNKFNIRANTSPFGVGSVVFQFDDITRTDSSQPYSLFGDRKGVYRGWRPEVGTYALTAIPYSQTRGRGTPGQALTISFVIVRDNEEPEPTPTSTPPAEDQAVVELTLVDADNDRDIMPLTNGRVINLAELPTKNVNVRANTNPGVVGSVRFELEGRQSHGTIENIVPYALFGDSAGDFYPWVPGVGEYTLSAVPYSQNNAEGQAGEPLTVEFEVVDGDSTASTPTPETPVATPTPETEPTGPPASSVPLCDKHDPTAWHALYNSGENCHYDHEHKQDPGEANDIFGPVAGLYGGQEISYPWQTFSAAGTENQLKHGGYGWLVSRGLDCYSAYSDGCLTDFRVQYHAIMAAPGAVTRFHSFWLEARGCRESNPDQCGIIRTGGWADYGRLEIDGKHIPLPGDPTDFVPGRRIHYYDTGNSNFGT
jgi:hypothetical protein